MSAFAIRTPLSRARGVRPAALLAGWSLAAMAALGPIAVFFALPAGLTGLAAVIVLAVAALDIIIAVALTRVFWADAPWLATTAAAFRIVYAAVFAVAAAELLSPADPAGFQKIWDAGLLLFGIHLLVLAVVCVKSPVPQWIAALVALAGAGYVLDAVLVALTPEPMFALTTVTFVGEVVLLVWLIARGGVARRDQ